LKGKYLFIFTPEDWAFQHWLPDVLPKLTQWWDILQADPEIKVLTGAPNPSHSPMVPYMWDHLNLTNRLHTVEGSRNFLVEFMYYGCVAPAINPVLWQRAHELLRVPHVPMKDRDVIVWMSRKSGARNPGRRVLNEDDIVETLTEYAASHNARVMTWKHEDIKSAQDAIDFFSHVRVILGPHGGALFNLFFAPKETAVVEFFPRELYGRVGGNVIVWYQSTMLQQDYWRIHAKSVGQDMEVSTDDILEILGTYF